MSSIWVLFLGGDVHIRFRSSFAFTSSILQGCFPPFPSHFVSSFFPCLSTLPLFLLASARLFQLTSLGAVFSEWVEVALFILSQGFAPAINNNNNNSHQRTMISSSLALDGCRPAPPSSPLPSLCTELDLEDWVGTGEEGRGSTRWGVGVGVAGDAKGEGDL